MTPIALITGAYRGLGLETARQLAAKGFSVILTARQEQAGRTAAEQLGRETGQTVRFVPMDVLDDRSIAAALEAIRQWTDGLDVLINNAAVFPDPSKDALSTPRSWLLDTFNTNTASVLMITQSFLPLLRKSRCPPARIVNISSGLGALSDMQNSCTAYSISKTALNAVTRQLAAALRDDRIPVNSVCPGWVRTEMGGPNAPRSVEEGASGIVWLATEAPAEQTGGFFRDRQPIPW